MAKPNRTNLQTTQTQYVRKPKVTPQIMNQPPQIVATQTQAQQQNAATFSDTDNNPYRDMFNMRSYYQSQSFDIDTQQAINYYLDPWEESGSLYNQAQNLNWNMSQGIKLTANQQYIYDGLMDGMHNLGYNSNLVRYDHQGFVNKLLSDNGINGTVDTLSMNQLQSLVGVTYSENKFNSTSYNDFKNATDASAFKSREIKIEYKAPAKTQAIVPGFTYDKSGRHKNDLGEVVLAPNQNYRIKSIKYNGNKARQKGTQTFNKQQITIEVEIF